jgi:hypothetical protein
VLHNGVHQIRDFGERLGQCRRIAMGVNYANGGSNIQPPDVTVCFLDSHVRLVYSETVRITADANEPL